MFAGSSAHETAGRQNRRSPVPTESVATGSLDESGTARVATGGGSKKRGRDGVSPRLSPVPDVLFQTAAIQASQVCSKFGYHGLSQLLASKSVSGSAGLSVGNSILGSGGENLGASSGPGAGISGLLPSIAQVQQAATKAHQEQPPWIHWSKTDMAHASMRVTSTNRLELQANLSINSNRAGGGGYRMARANTGCSSGSHYFEVWVLPPPTTQEVLQSLPPSIRLAPGLRRSLQASVEYEEKAQTKQQQQAPRRQASTGSEPSSVGGDPNSDGDSNSPKRQKLDESVASPSQNSESVERVEAPSEPPRRVGGHVRVGWSMRTGELQAPVGYDRWSFAIRDIGGSIITNSQRIDNWVGAEGFGPGDVIGCAISLDDTKDDDDQYDDGYTNNRIRFFKNGICMGEFVIAKGKRSGGEAPFQSDIPAGTYYPAVSCYMGGSVRANFGPRFVYPPRKLPAGLKLTPISEVSPPPETDPQVVMAQIAPIIKLLRTGGWKNPDAFQHMLQQSIQAEARILKNMYANYQRQNLMEVKQLRLDRGMAVQDLDDALGVQPETGP
mmetsp:Transcript_13661/g.28223  ORF Transcript_13661/g.28223 Transcript_13661/m.28223 type:complete len:555 (-) Transcript_13661:19-1683(-)|eukprot:CAMPEP_0172462282 /NCGR_PEP_ID=MMETSP1065-20121228/43374_1 /TAXON_ID=265537 /ORGANISM="Amphiprora paludosa, Strain CCMP125" /LENGTH=554 /DNA_ID=CAMNT_0013217901 /DNA_START=29 /DNA_END=1693 /DNA_ORIENTATION=-